VQPGVAVPPSLDNIYKESSATSASPVPITAA
jgi:uracil DNA glycosylase